MSVEVALQVITFLNGLAGIIYTPIILASQALVVRPIISMTSRTYETLEADIFPHLVFGFSDDGY